MYFCQEYYYVFGQTNSNSCMCYLFNCPCGIEEFLILEFVHSISWKGIEWVDSDYWPLTSLYPCSCTFLRFVKFCYCLFQQTFDLSVLLSLCWASILHLLFFSFPFSLVVPIDFLHSPWLFIFLQLCIFRQIVFKFIDSSIWSLLLQQHLSYF